MECADQLGGHELAPSDASIGQQEHAVGQREQGAATWRMAEVSTLLTGQPEATPENGIVWLQELTAALSIPGLASYKLSEEDIPAVVTAAQNASSMRGNPIELSDAEVTDIVARSL